MRILNKFGEEMKEYDSSLGYVKEEQIVAVHHEAVEAIEEKGHYETIAEYPNGGKDILWVIDVVAQPKQEAWDEYETILRYVPHSKEVLAEIEVAELKSKLAETDWISSKLGDELISCTSLGDMLSAFAALHTKYKEQIEQRKQWRARINELEL